MEIFMKKVFKKAYFDSNFSRESADMIEPIIDRVVPNSVSAVGEVHFLSLTSTASIACSGVGLVHRFFLHTAQPTVWTVP